MVTDPRTTAFIAVHFQHDVVGDTGAMAGLFREQVEARQVLDAAGRLLQAARSAGAPTVYTRVAWAPDLSDLDANSPLLGMVAQSRFLIEGTPGAEIVPELAPGGADHVMTHKRIGGFSASGLQDWLQQRGARTLVLFGVATNASVEGTARQASDLGYRTIVVEDACSAATPAAHTHSIESLALLAEISTVGDITAALKPANTAG
ncbi:cysteine hydrolase family protein [Actinomycetospora sp. CA-084318]|uniref:cysteine hydrolase family protein n=1 Tax=Actinomycetospora sp. CA-084318 TaxID=3239892 RepID=UPI003D990AF4